jgi:hypothetical protein
MAANRCTRSGSEYSPVEPQKLYAAGPALLQSLSHSSSMIVDQQVQEYAPLPHMDTLFQAGDQNLEEAQDGQQARLISGSDNRWCSDGLRFVCLFITGALLPISGLVSCCW